LNRGGTGESFFVNGAAKSIQYLVISIEGKHTMGDKGKKDRDKREKQKAKQQASLDKKKQQKNVKAYLTRES
jgi:hypothetical protein